MTRPSANIELVGEELRCGERKLGKAGATATAEQRDWLKRGIELANEDGDCQAGIAARQFKVGDWLTEGVDKWRGREVYHYAETIFPHYHRTTLRDLAFVSRSVQTSLRNDVLSWAHHRAVAPLNAVLQKQYLDVAATEQLSILALRKRIRVEQHQKKPRSNAAILTFQWSGYRRSCALPDWIQEAVNDLSCVSSPNSPCLEPVDVVARLISRALTELPDIVALLDKIKAIKQKEASRGQGHAA